MSIVTDLTPTQYYPVRLVVEIKPDVILTAASLSFHTDLQILNADGAQVGNDHPTPPTTAAQRTAFLTWVQNCLAAYEAAVGLTRYTEGV